MVLSKYFEIKTSTDSFKNHVENIIAELSGKKVLVYGMGEGFKSLDKIYGFSEKLDVVAIADKRYEKEKNIPYKNIKTIMPQGIRDEKFDYLLVTNEHFSPIVNFLKEEFLMPTEKIKCLFFEEIDHLILKFIWK